MWIRSKDKNSISKYDGISIDGKYIYGYVHVDTNNCSNLGCYETEEKAREVFECMQAHINEIEFNRLKASATLMDWKSFTDCWNIIFEMPQG